jgi:bacteriocin resistance YdeI/OmpD-like protein
MGAEQRFKAVVMGGPDGSIFIPVPFDPNAVWGEKPRHHVRGCVGLCKVRGPLGTQDGLYGLKLGPAWVRDNPHRRGDTVDVALAPEGPQRATLDPDIAEALQACPQAARFFDGLAQFYRKGYLTWIAGTKKRPQERARRIAEMVRLLEAGTKQRSK